VKPISVYLMKMYKRPGPEEMQPVLQNTDIFCLYIPYNSFKIYSKEYNSNPSNLSGFVAPPDENVS